MQKPDPRHATSIQRSRVGRSRRRVAGTAVLVLAGAGLAPLVAATPASAAAQSVTFSTPGLHTFIVPDSVTSITVDAIGGAGGSYQQSGGAGAEVTGTFAVTPGDRIPVHVASDGAFQSAGVNGGGAATRAGGGGGASDVRIGADDLQHRVLVAAGGGGAGAPGGSGPVGGDAGQPGQDGLVSYCGPSGNPHSAAQPGGDSSGGSGGTGCGFYLGNPGGDGVLGAGGDGGYSDGSQAGGGGGGGGYYGGGGAAPYGGGAGGSSYLSSVATSTSTGLAAAGATPSVTIGYDGPPPQTIAFTTPAPSDAGIGGSYQIEATGGGSGNPVTFSTNSSTCSVSSAGTSKANVFFHHAGDCVVLADQAGDASYAPASEEEQTISIRQTPQGITFVSMVPQSPAIGGTYQVSATGGPSGNPVTFSTSSPACSLAPSTKNAATVSFLHAGDCVIDADQAGTSDYSAADQAEQTVTVPQTAQPITFHSVAPSPAVRGGSYVASATGGGSGNPVTFSTTSPACSLVDNGDGTATVSFLSAGSCAVVADQAGTSDYAAGEAQQTTTIARSAQTITFPALKAMRLHHANQALHATASSKLPVTYTVRTPRVCSLVRSAVHALRAGTCTVVAHQAGNSQYLAAPTKTRSLRVTR